MQGRAGEAAFFDSELIIKRILINLFKYIHKKSNISCRVHVINYFKFSLKMFFSVR
jgi:hypothetical protein